MKRDRDPAAAGEELEGARLVGDLLRQRRELRGLTPEDVGLALRFGTRQIVAIEEGRFADLPPQPYAQGLIGAYASLVGLDPDEMLRICSQSFARKDDVRRSSIFRYPHRERFNWREWTVPLTLAAAAATVAIARSALMRAPVELEVPATAPVALVRPAQPAAPAAAAVLPPPAVLEAAPGVRVLLRCEGTTWVEATSDGAELRRYDLGPGQNLELTARERLSLALGDAGVIRLRVNDRELGFIGDKGEKKFGLSFVAQKGTGPRDTVTADGD